MPSYTPITKVKFVALLKKEESALNTFSNEKYQKYKKKPGKRKCFRFVDVDDDMVYVVAKMRNRVVLYDDAEQEFAIGTIEKNGIITEWVLYGSLKSAIMNL